MDKPLMSGLNGDDGRMCYYFGDPQAKDDYMPAFNPVDSEELPKESILPYPEWVMIDQPPPSIYSQGNNSPSPQPIAGRKRPGTAVDRYEQKKKSDRIYRERQREEKKQMESKLEELKKENEKLKKENGILKRDKCSAEQKLHLENQAVNQLRIDVSRLSQQSDTLRILVNAFVNKILQCANADEQLKQLKDEVSLIEIGWEDWMSEKLKFLNGIERLKNQNRILSIQVRALSKLQHSE